MTNIQIKDAAGYAKTLATTTVEGVDTPHHRDPEAIAALAALHADIATTLASYVDGLETLVGLTNSGLSSILAKLIAAPATEAKQDTLIAALGATSGAAVITDANGTVQQYLRGLIKQWIAGTLVLGAGENHVGQVGGATVNFQPAITVDATPDYSDGDDIFGKLTLPVARVAGGSGYLTRLQLRSRINITVGTFLHIFDADPSASTFTKNAAMVLHANDQVKLLRTIAISSADWIAPKGVSPWYTVELIGAGAAIPSLAYDLASGVNLYAAFEGDGTINFGSTDDINMVVAAENN